MRLPQSQALPLAIYPRLLRYAKSLVQGDSHTAEDLVQEAYLRRLDSRAAPLEHPGHWMQVVVRNLAWSRFKRSAYSQERCTLEEVAEPNLAVEAAPTEEESSLEPLLKGLPPKQRRTLRLRFEDDRSIEDCARQLGIPYSTARSYQRRGLRALRQSLAPGEGSSPKTP